MTTEIAPAPASTDVILRLTDVNTYYGAIHALRGLDVEVRRGEIVTLIGANGAGKTTTLRTISGLLHARQGSVELNGVDITKTDPHVLVTRGIGHAPEGRRIFSRLTIYENLLMGGFTRSKAENEEQVAHVYELFPRLKERHAQKGGTLSGGEQQMLAIGRALMTRPTVLLLDEPSLGLAPILVQQIFKIIREINAGGMTILLVEQNALQALSIANRGYVLQTGEVVLSGSAPDLMVNETVRKAYLGED
jgi:branched-chain amino acid transport system ATP-binding protein